MGVFYLRSRGVAEPLARKLLTYAFAAEVLEEIPFASVRRRLEAMVMARLDVPAED
jgi:Fe-S cluster assembly protein SufD